MEKMKVRDQKFRLEPNGLLPTSTLAELGVPFTSPYDAKPHPTYTLNHQTSRAHSPQRKKKLPDPKLKAKRSSPPVPVPPLRPAPVISGNGFSSNFTYSPPPTLNSKFTALNMSPSSSDKKKLGNFTKRLRNFNSPKQKQTKQFIPGSSSTGSLPQLHLNTNFPTTKQASGFSDSYYRLTHSATTLTSGGSNDTFSNRASPSTPSQGYSPPHEYTRAEHRRVSSRKKNIEQNSSFCSICDLPLNNTLAYSDASNNEKILELTCHHYAHEECLLLLMEFVSAESKDKGSTNSYFPDCRKCANGTTAIPLVPSISDEVVSKFLTEHKYTYHSSNNLVAGLMSPNPMDYLPPGAASPSIQTRRSQQFTDAILSITPPPREAFRKHHKKQSRGSSVSAISSIISSVTDTSPVLNNHPIDTIYSSIGSSWNSHFSLELLREKFVDELTKLSQQDLIENSDDAEIKISPGIVESFGNLRLFDKLKLSEDGDNWCDCYCYLFEHMLVSANLNDKQFQFMSISSFISVDAPSNSVLSLKPSKNDKVKLYFNCENSNILEKWAAALSNLQSSFSNELITSTVNEDEFYDILKFNEDNANTDTLRSSSFISSIGGSLSRGGSTAMRKLPLGVNPKFYESTINSVVLKRKPVKMVIALNQLTTSPSSIIAVKNIIRSLLLIRIDILVVLTSSDDLNAKTPILRRGEIKKGCGSEELEDFLLIIDQFSELINSKSPFSSSSGDCEMFGDSLSQYIKANTDVLLDDIVTVILSATTLRSIYNLPTVNNIPIEVSATSSMDRGSKRLSVANLANWDEAMEVICWHCGLEFDDSDFESSDDDEDDDEDENDDEDEDDDGHGKDDHEEQRANDNDEDEKADAFRQSLLPNSQVAENSASVKGVGNSSTWTMLINGIDEAIKETQLY